MAEGTEKKVVLAGSALIRAIMVHELYRKCALRLVYNMVTPPIYF